MRALRMTGSTLWLLGVVGVTSIGAVSCVSGRHEASPVARAATSTLPWCGRLHPGVGAKPREVVRTSSAVALSQDGPRTLAYVADADDSTLHVVNVDSQTEIATVPLEGSPSQVLVVPDGRVLVSLRDSARVEVLEPTGGVDGALVERCAVPAPAEPIALALSPDDSTVLVTAGWGHSVAAFSTATLEARYQVDVPPEPRAIVVSDDGKKAYVSHAVGAHLSVVDLVAAEHPVRDIPMVAKDKSQPARRVVTAMPMVLPKGAPTKMMMKPRMEVRNEPKERVGCQGFALAKSIVPDGRIFAPQVLVDSGDTTVRSSGYGTSLGAPAEVGDVAVIDQGSDAPFASSLEVLPDPAQALGLQGAEATCLLPRAAAVDDARHALFVACVGSDTLVELDAKSADPHAAEIASFHVGSGPIGVAVDSLGGRAVVFSQFDRAVHVVELGAVDKPAEEDAKIASLALSRRAGSASTGDFALGRRLFHLTGDPRISSDGRACASCHPDGRDDSITWATPDGPRNTPMLAGRLEGTAPYAWSGTGESVQGHLTHTFQRLRGTGLRGEELDALVAYITHMAPPKVARAPGSPKLARGEAIFHSGEAGCSGCHGKGGVSPDGQLHDVGSAAAGDVKKEFDTPSLRYVAGSGPYFHDGRYATLHDLLTKTDGQMGKTSQLTPADLDALETYVRSL